MKRIEILGRDGLRLRSIERFCVQMQYPHSVRDIRKDPCARTRYEILGGTDRPIILIGPTMIKNLKALINTEPFIIQQMLAE